MRVVVVAVTVAALLPFTAAPAGAGTAHHGHAHHRWVHYADMDNDSVPDRIVITAGDDLHSRNGGYVQGHYDVTVYPTTTGRTVSRRFFSDGYAGWRRHWTPWFGSTRIDQVGGKEIVLGAETGASAQLYRVVAYWNGALRVVPPPPTALPSPDGNKWLVDGTALHSTGFTCTSRGIAPRWSGATPHSARRGHRFLHWRVFRHFYRWQDAHWVKTGSAKSRQRVREGRQPHGARQFGAFVCPGLPRFGHHMHQGRRWVHHADMDNDGVPDRILITAGPKLEIDQGSGIGPYRVHVRLSSTGLRLTRLLRTEYYHPITTRDRRWSPWFGKTVIDHVGGMEILLGTMSGASSSTFDVLAYADGQLVDLPAPRNYAWSDVAVATSGGGFKCTNTGIVFRSYSNHDRHYRRWTITRSSYEWHDNAWQRTRYERHVRITDNPKHAGRLGEVHCPGLPRS
jgi:hypothetical protein